MPYLCLIFAFRIVLVQGNDVAVTGMCGWNFFSSSYHMDKLLCSFSMSANSISMCGSLAQSSLFPVAKVKINLDRALELFSDIFTP